MIGRSGAFDDKEHPRSAETEIIPDPMTGEPPVITPDPPAGAPIQVGNPDTGAIIGRALVLGPDEWLFINLGENAEPVEADELWSTFRTHLPPEVCARIMLVAVESMAVVPKGKKT